MDILHGIFFRYSVYDEGATVSFLLETYLHGSPILSYVHAPLEQRQELAWLGCATALKMIFSEWLCPQRSASGNILVEDTGNFLKLHLLDCGLVIEMGPEIGGTADGQ